MVRQARCNRVHSAVTHQVNVIEAGKVNVHTAFLTLSSGQLPFLGLVSFDISVFNDLGPLANFCLDKSGELLGAAAFRNRALGLQFLFDIVARLQAEVSRILALPDVKQKLEAQGAIPEGGSSEQLATFIQAEIGKWAKVIKDGNIKAD